jgi:hypothetical protein
MATLVPVATTRTLMDLDALAVAVDVGGSDKWINTGRELAYVSNGSGSPLVVTETLASTALVDGLAPAARTISIPAGHHAIIGPFPPGTYNNPSDGTASLGWGATTTIKVLIFYPGN